MEALEKTIDIIGKILLALVIIWILGVKIFSKFWKKLTSIGK